MTLQDISKTEHDMWKQEGVEEYIKLKEAQQKFLRVCTVWDITRSEGLREKYDWLFNKKKIPVL